MFIGSNNVLKDCTVGEGTLITNNCFIPEGCIIGKNCHIGIGTQLEKNTKIPDNSTVIGKLSTLRYLEHNSGEI